MRVNVLKVLFVAIAMVLVLGLPRDAQALDKRLKLAMKTGGYGAAAGTVIGAGTVALGLGGFRNVMMGASSGLYAGLLLAAYIVATPAQAEDDALPGRSRNPFGPRKPISPDDYEDADEEELKPYLPPKTRDSDDSRASPPSAFELARVERELKTRGGLEVWAPLLSVQW